MSNWLSKFYATNEQEVLSSLPATTREVKYRRDGKVKVMVDRELCIGVSNCVAIAPTVFKLDDQNKVVVLDPSSVDKDTLVEAARSCPEKAIILEDEEGNQAYP